ncbi:DnaJ domain-containing protein [Chloroflexota bacterium]
MKDYYQILGVQPGANPKAIKQTFRRLAFRYHPDQNPGQEPMSAEKFKEINEAFGVLGDARKRAEYDRALNNPFTAGTQASGFSYSQQDIFSSMAGNADLFSEISRMFAQAGLNYDQAFFNRTFGGGAVRFYTSRGSQPNRSSQPKPGVTPAKLGWFSSLLAKVATGLTKALLKAMFRISAGQPTSGLDHTTEIPVTRAEAASGTEKLVTYQRQGEAKQLLVQIPSGVKTGTKIRLKGMGISAGNSKGNLYLKVKISG